MNSTPINLRLAPDLLALLDAHIAASSEPDTSRPEAVRQILASVLRYAARDRAP